MPKRAPKLNLILLGDPGAGKATQGAYFAKKYKLHDHDMGRELTILREKDKKVDLVQQRTADKGGLTPTAIARKINRDVINKLPKGKGILFDGHPKMLGEAKLISAQLKKKKLSNPLVLYIQIPLKETVKRVRARKGYYNTKFGKRPDDTVAALRNRARYYRKNIREVVEYFQNVYTLAHIDGLGTRAEVQKRIQKAIDFYLDNYEQINQKT